MTGRMVKMMAKSDAKFRLAVTFGEKTVNEAKRAVEEKTFDEEQKKLWKKEILKTYIGKKCSLYHYASGLVERIEKDEVESKDFEWIEDEMIPLFESDLKLYESKIGV